jgi:putative transposase
VKDEATRIEKLRYIHRNPAERGPCAKPEDWPWSGFRHYLSGIEGVVEIESDWIARKRERMGQPLRVKSQQPHSSQQKA